MAPDFSIITPSYNQAEFLEETILSVKSQTGVKFEHIVIDGGSTDGSVEILKKYADGFSYWVSEKDRGQSHAINKGLEKASGRYLMWLNSDDVLLPGALERIKAAFEQHPEIEMIHGKSILFGNRKKEQIVGEPKEHLPLRYLAYIPFPQPSSFFRKSLVERSGLLDENLHYGMDFELLVRSALLGKVIYLNETLSRYRIHSQSKSLDHLRFAKEWNEVFSRVMNSIPGNDHRIQQLKEWKWFSGSGKNYPCTLLLNEKELDTIVFLHLEVQLHYHYQSGDHSTTLSIARILQEHFPDEYAAHGISRINNRARFIPSQVVHLLRKIKGV